MVKPMRWLVMALAVAAPILAASEPARAQVAFTFRVDFAPPELPVYEQPICPGEGYLWTPGYWAWDDEDGDYYWVPGTWVLTPEPGFLWTPGYWAWYDSAYVFYPGYWGPVVGFYGGINYGFGYFGHGYEGGRWEGGRFYYNRSVNNINVTEIHNVYNTTIVNRNETRVSFNGGNGGVNARPSAEEQAAARERHIAPVAAQQQHVQQARANRALRASENHGKPPIAATPRPASFGGGGVVAARSGGNYNPPANRGGANRPAARTDRPPNARAETGATNRPTYVHPNQVPKHNEPPFTPSGNPKSDQRYQQQQQKMYQKQEQEHQKLQQKQEKEHAQAAQRQANEAQKQQMEQRHQQQTQQMEQRHSQQQQQMQQRAPQPRPQPGPPHGEPRH